MYSPSRDLTQQSGDSLEERLRGLILNNGSAGMPATPGAGNQPLANTIPPPHSLSGNTAEQQAYLAEQNTHSEVQKLSTIQQQMGQPGKKKLNQAQRRQMNSHLSIPIDPRPESSKHFERGGHPYARNVQLSSGSPQYGYSQPHRDQRSQYGKQQYLASFPGQGQASPYPAPGPYSQAPSPLPLRSGLSHAPPLRPESDLYRQPQQYPPRNYAPEPSYGRTPPPNRQVLHPGSYGGHGGYVGYGEGRTYGHKPENVLLQSAYLTQLIQGLIPTIIIHSAEELEKDGFRALVERACREAIAGYEHQELSNLKFDADSVELKCFGSMSSGFATGASDMDLALLSPFSNPPPDSPNSPIPRLLERKLLDLGYGARLLTRTRVPIIKLCQKPPKKLLSDLLEERTKWENGFVTEPADTDRGLTEVKIPGREAETSKKSVLSPSPELSTIDPTSQWSTLNGDQVILLNQKEQQSLGDYYNTAKRLLRKLGGRDISASCPNVTEREGKVLNDVCRAFILGLQSESLGARLRGYRSISHLFDSTLPAIQQTLSGVWIQVEGERLAMAFNDRPLTESQDKREHECLNIVESWRLLQDNCGPTTDPLRYNRQLYLAAEKLKHISSLQLIFLEQIEFEEPINYQRRAQRIMEDLRGREQSATISQIVITQYIAGINDLDIKKQLQSDRHRQTSLDEVCLQHRALQLAADYEHALAKGVFDESDQSFVEQYIAVLRNPTKQLNTVAGAHKSLVEKIRALPDPTKISLNRQRDRYRDHLEFPKTDIGVQCDINFSADLALHNTLLLRCYSHSDHRVRPLVLFVKHWAKIRSINTPYRGSLSSYGYVLMVLHYLVNIVQPFVCPNLQLLHKDPPAYLPPAEIQARTRCNGRDVRFWRNEVEIRDLANRGLLNHNKDSVGLLLRGFFEYFAQGGQMSTVQHRGFDWGREVLSIRTPGGILTKQEKGWVGAKTTTETSTISAPIVPSIPGHPDVISKGEAAMLDETEFKSVKTKTVEETKEIRHRYLFAIEDPFETDHNVARTVTHNGIVSIRDEFRRAWRIIKDMGEVNMAESLTGKGSVTEGLLDPVVNEEAKSNLQELLDLIHGSPGT